MSRIGRAPVEVPNNVEVDLSGRTIRVKGPKGELTVPVGRGVEVRQEDGSLVLERASDSPDHKAMHGLTRSLLQNAVTGVTDGFAKTLVIQGVGYRGALQGVACCDSVNRGSAYWDGKIFYNTLDAHTVAVDAATGKEVWKTKVGEMNQGESVTMAPLVVKGKVLVGNSGGEFGVRGWL